MQDAWRAYLEFALGLTEASKKKAEDVAKKLIGKGGATASQLQTLAEDLFSTSATNREALTKIVRFEVDRALGVVGLATAEEVSDLTGRVRDLERQLREAQARAAAAEAAAGETRSAPAGSANGGSASVTATPPPTAAKKTVGKKTVGKKTVVKKTVGKNAGVPARTGGETASPTKALAKKTPAAVKKARPGKAVGNKTAAKKTPPASGTGAA